MHYNTHSCLLYERYIVPMAHYLGGSFYLFNSRYDANTD